MSRREFYGRPAAVYVIIRDGDKILMLKRVGPWKPGQYVPPSGHVEAKETLRQAAAREVMEEVGLTVLPKDLSFKFVTHRHPGSDEVDDREYLDFYFEASKYLGEARNMEPEKHSKMVWMTKEDTALYPVVDYTKEALGLIDEGHTYGEFDWE